MLRLRPFEILRPTSREEAAADPSFERFFWTDTTRGDYWIQQRKDTFRSGLERVYDEARRSLDS